MSRGYKTSVWQRVYGKAMQDGELHRRPPADRLFGWSDAPRAAAPDPAHPGIAAGERAHFAEHFARDFAAALSEARRAVSPA